MQYTYQQLSQMTGRSIGQVRKRVSDWGIAQSRRQNGVVLLDEGAALLFCQMTANNLLKRMPPEEKPMCDRPKYYHGKGNKLVQEGEWWVLKTNDYYLRQPLCAKV